MAVSSNEEIFTTWTRDVEDADVSVTGLCGELDASSAPAFLGDMQQVIRRGRDLIMDVHLLEYTDSTGVAAILSIRNALREAGRRLCLVGCHGLLTKILHAIGVGESLPCYDDMDQAVADLKQPGV